MITDPKTLRRRHVGRTQIRKIGEKVLMRTDTVGLYPAIGDEGEELIEDVVRNTVTVHLIAQPNS